LHRRGEPRTIAAFGTICVDYTTGYKPDLAIQPSLAVLGLAATAVLLGAVRGV
jgi:hypothetical protein